MARAGRKIVVPSWVYEKPDTGIKWVWRWCLEIGQIQAAADAIGWSVSRLNTFLRNPRVGISGKAAVDLSHKLKIPIEAVVLKNKPLRDITVEQLPGKDPEEGWE